MIRALRLDLGVSPFRVEFPLDLVICPIVFESLHWIWGSFTEFWGSVPLDLGSALLDLRVSHWI